MKSNSGSSDILTLVLQGALALSVIMSLVFIMMFRNVTSEARTLGAQMNVVNVNRTKLQLLATDSLEYGKQHPSVLPILKSVGIELPTQVKQ